MGMDQGSLRQRVLLATEDVIGEIGFEAASVEAIAEAAGVETAELLEQFEDKTDCFVQTQDAMGRRGIAVARAAFEEGSEWREGLRRSAYAIADFMQERPGRVRFGFFEPFAVGDRATGLHDRYLRLFSDLIDAGRDALDDPSSVPPETAQAVIGSITKMMFSLAGEGRPITPETAIPQIMYLAVLPYRGSEAAREELTMPRPT